MPGVCDLSDDIQRDINANYGVFYQMYADVANQSTSSLVEGVPDDEDKYDYAFYFGEKRNLLSGSPAKDRPVYSNYVFRDDYYKDGGYICPAFIEYTAVFQATNARGEWQYIVNVKPWTQTGKVPLNVTVVPPGEESRFGKTSSVCFQCLETPKLLWKLPKCGDVKCFRNFDHTNTATHQTIWVFFRVEGTQNLTCPVLIEFCTKQTQKLLWRSWFVSK